MQKLKERLQLSNFGLNIWFYWLAGILIVTVLYLFHDNIEVNIPITFYPWTFGRAGMALVRLLGWLGLYLILSLLPVKWPSKVVLWLALTLAAILSGDLLYSVVKGFLAHVGRDAMGIIILVLFFYVLTVATIQVIDQNKFVQDESYLARWWTALTRVIKQYGWWFLAAMILGFVDLMLFKNFGPY